jgi:hypothetical protein
VNLRGLLVGAVLLAVGAGSAAVGAQRPTPRPPVIRTESVAGRDSLLRRAPGDTTRQRGDTLTPSDTAARPNLVAPDSTMQRLLALPGYDVRQYQSEAISFDALTRGICLARRATIASGDSLLAKSDRICSTGAGTSIKVGSDTSRGRNIITLPGQKPIYSSGVGIYDIAHRRAIITEVRTSLEQSGQLLQIRGERIVAVLPPKDSLAATRAAEAMARGDTTAAGRGAAFTSKDATFYLRDGTITACTDSIPDYFFKAGQIKRTGSFVVARPAVLYIGDVPVMWLPFLFQDVRGGRHSGLLAPNVGVSDIVRNSPSYRRSIEGLGYYVALSDYVDAQAYLDWRSSAGQSDAIDPGYMRYNGELRYNWIDRYVRGRVAVSQTTQGASKNTAISIDHSQEFTRNASLTASYNYVTNTFLQRQTTVNPLQVSATIRSSANYTQKAGPFNFTLGGQQTQYPGRTQVDRNFPSFNMSTSPIDVGSWLVWTPTLSYSAQSTLRIDQPSNLGLFLRPGLTPAGIDTTFGDTLRRNAYSSTLSVGTPIQVFGYAIGNQFNVSSRLNNFPQLELVSDVRTGVVTPRIYAATYESNLDWTPSFSLPPLARNNFNLSPSVSLQNVDPSAFAIRNHRTGGAWVHQSKRPTFGLSASPSLFGLFGGFGPYSRLRHQISPTFGYSYAPAGNVSDEFLRARGVTRYNATTGDTTGYLGGLAQNALTFQLATNLEAKSRSKNDSNPEAGEKVKLVSLVFTPLSYDFERARATHSRIRGLTSTAFGYTITSDLLPGLDVGVNYSLFEGSTLSDTAKFNPFREGVTASFKFSNTANPFAVFARLFGKAVPDDAAPVANPANPQPDDRYARQVASQPVAGRSSARAAFQPTTVQGWDASFQFTAQRHRPLSGSNVIAFDPTVRCSQYNTPRLQLAYDQCVAQARANPPTENPLGSGLAGSTIIAYPNTTSLGSQLSFNLTEHWSAQYQTNYDFELHNFATQIVSLQRDLHDWRAIFAFTQGANGAFAFNFLISLKAEPELKFDYHKATYRGAGY